MAGSALAAVAPYDLILGSDCIYHREHHERLRCLSRPENDCAVVSHFHRTARSLCLFVFLCLSVLVISKSNPLHLNG